jgi:hypothetical protein
MGNRQQQTPEERATISELFSRYLQARNYSYSDLASETGLAPGSKSIYTRALQGKGLSANQALRIHRVLRFGVVQPGDPPELRPEDRDIWLEATHAAELVELAIDDEVETWVERLLQHVHGWLAMPAYAHTWGTARWRELCLDFVQAEPRLEQALRAAIISEAPAELLGIMRQDLTEAYLAKGNLAKARQECTRAERGFENLHRDTDGTTAKLGLGRAKAQWLQIAAWEGCDAAICRERAEEALALMRDIDDHYGACKIRHILAYVDLVDGNLESAAREVKDARIEARQIKRTANPYWALRDGLLFGAQWMELHAFALSADVDAAIGHVTGEPLSASQLLLPDLSQFARRWAQQIPPLYPFYSWRYQLSTRSTLAQKAELERRIRRMTNGGLIMYAPHAMLSCGDFLAEVAADLEGARSWYQRAHELAGEHGLLRAQRMVEARLEAA